MKQAKNFYFSKLCFLSIIFTLSSCISFSADVYGGAYTIEKVTVTDVWNDDFSPGEPRDEFDGDERVIAIVETSGYDGIITMRWFHEDQLIYETSNKTQNNYFSTHIGPENEFYWLYPGEYRVEVGLLDDPKFVEHFTVREDGFERFELTQPIPTPSGHVKEEESGLVEIPFAFDEIWVINGEEWKLNEAKVVFLRTSSRPVLSFLFTQPNLVKAFSSQEEGKARTIKVARYAKENGYFDIAENIVIGGNNYSFEHIFISFIDNNKDGYRVAFELSELD